MQESQDEALKEYIGKKIYFSLGDTMEDDGTLEPIEALFSGILLAVKGRWVKIRGVLGKREEIRLYNINKIFYITTEPPKYSIDGKKLVQHVDLKIEGSKGGD